MGQQNDNKAIESSPEEIKREGEKPPYIKDEDRRKAEAVSEEELPREQLPREDLARASPNVESGNLYYVPPGSVLKMPPTARTEELKQDAEMETLIERGFTQIDFIREQIDKEQIEIERLKSETRRIISSLLI